MTSASKLMTPMSTTDVERLADALTERLKASGPKEMLATVKDTFINPVQSILGYATGMIFIVGIAIYIYMLIIDHAERSGGSSGDSGSGGGSDDHTQTEKAWIYIFLITMIVGYFVSYYSITVDIYSKFITA